MSPFGGNLFSLLNTAHQCFDEDILCCDDDSNNRGQIVPTSTMIEYEYSCSIRTSSYESCRYERVQVMAHNFCLDFDVQRRATCSIGHGETSNNFNFVYMKYCKYDLSACNIFHMPLLIIRNVCFKNGRCVSVTVTQTMMCVHSNHV